LLVESRPIDAAVVAFSLVLNGCDPPAAAEALQDLFEPGCPRCGEPLAAVRLRPDLFECRRGHRWSP
jgi:hypothetical protein